MATFVLDILGRKLAPIGREVSPPAESSPSSAGRFRPRPKARSHQQEGFALGRKFAPIGGKVSAGAEALSFGFLSFGLRGNRENIKKSLLLADEKEYLTQSAYSA